MKHKFLLPILLALFALSFACSSPGPNPHTGPRRIVAFADVHGDLAATRRALLLAGAIDERDHWIGGDLIVVQTGDQLDRGDGERAILELFERLAGEARAAGGEFHSLLGNHEVMNVAGDFRYVTPGGFADFEDSGTVDPMDPALSKLAPHQRARASAFSPGGSFARLLSTHAVILVLEGNVFVHGGVLPQHVEYGIERINQETQAWMRGEREQPTGLRSADSPVWTRLFSSKPDEASAAVLRETLHLLGAQRMVMGHTVQSKGISSSVQGAAWCLDVGMASHYGGPIEVLQIIGDEVTVLR